ncbi:hypothetical protein ILUMI_02314 [Ignelater luminosus]|uniref:ascorbate ferrireductase (transmembrane) n=1 Tax=Ignelater luminosus TaxID=2038154 RepID=A0A8K0GGK1_IGNLU|nr:hypothetical protein ILUMI_02314 [Ignelater luminosus]
MTTRATSCEAIEENQENMTYKEHESSAQHKIFEYLTTVTHVLIIGFVLFILYLCLTNEWIFFTWHPVLLATGWVLLMSEGILLLAPNNTLTRALSLTHKSRVKYHWIIQIVGIVSSLAGFIVIYINKNLKDKPHFHSWHGLIGLISVIGFIPSIISGIVALYGFALKNYIKPVNSKLIHRICGILTFSIGSITVLLSLYTKWFQRNVNDLLTITWFIFISVILIWTISHASINVFRKLKTIL